jgi:hypothetical protein
MTMAKQLGWQALVLVFALGPFALPAIAQQASATDQQEPLASRVARPKSQDPLDNTQRPGVRPLQFAARLAERSLNEFDANITDYSAIFLKQERIDDVLGEEEAAFVKIRQKPFSAYMFFLKPNKGREVLYNEGPGGTKGVLVALESGWKRRLGKLELDPESRLAMQGQKYSIMELGIRTLIVQMNDVFSNKKTSADCKVKSAQRILNGRPVTLLEMTHPIRGNPFRFYKTEFFVDNQLHIPIRFASYSWPEKPGESAPLEESYTYLKLKINNRFTDQDFDQGNPAIFKDD